MWSWQRAQPTVSAEERLRRVLDRVLQPLLAAEQLVSCAPGSRWRAARRGRPGASSSAASISSDHAVVALVGVERLDDPVAPAPDVRLAVAHLLAPAGPVAVAPDVHPVPAPALAVPRDRQQPIDDLLVRVRRRVREEGVQLLRASAGGRSGRGRRAAAARASALPGRGFRPRASCSAAMKASIGLRTQRALRPLGTAAPHGSNGRQR